ncbi:MAG: hypothetical protein ACE5EU_12345 [Paracoccaceae bacterium]
MILTETSPAAVNPVPLDEFAAHLRMAQGFADDAAEDALLELYLRNATSVIEARVCKALIRRQFKLQVTAWNRDGQLVLPVGPVAAIDSVNFVQGATTIALAAGAWSLEIGGSRQRLTGAGGGALPAIPDGHVAELVFDAGFGASWNDVPGELSQAVMLLAAHYFENRYGDSDPGQGIPVAVQALLETQQPVRL